MPATIVYPGCPEPSHDVSLTNDVESIGLIYAQGASFLQEIPISDPSRPFTVNQSTWSGGKGRLRNQDDPSGIFDSQSLWTQTEGKVFPVPQWRLGRGLRNMDYEMPSATTGVEWQPLLTPQVYISRQFTTVGTYAADKAQIWVRRIGFPGTLTLELRPDSATTGQPHATTVTKSATKAYTDLGDSGDLFPPSQLLTFDWTTTTTLDATTIYHLVLYGTTDDNDANHWEVGVNTAGTLSKVSVAGTTTWAAGGFAAYFHVEDASIDREWYGFTLEGSMYIVSKNADGTASKLFINGDRGKATSATATTLVDTSSGVSAGWTADQWIGAYVRIIEGTGSGQVRQITDNDATSVTVAAWSITPDNTSRYIIYGTDYFTEVTGTGLGQVVSSPTVASKVAYFPQGAAAYVRRIACDHTAAIQHAFAANGTVYADLMSTHVNITGTQVWKALNSTSGLARAVPVTWGSNLAFGSEKVVGSSDVKVTNLFASDYLYVFKEDSFWRMEEDAPKKLKSGGLSDAQDPSNGIAAGESNDGMWWGWNHSIAKMVGANVSDQLNYKADYQGVPANRRGVVSSISAPLGWTFFVIDGGSTNYSSIISWNGMGWMELFRGWAVGVRIRNLFWQGNVGARPRLWFDIDGEMAYIEFPFQCANPLLDSTLAFQHEGVLITSTFDANDGTLYKLFHDFRVVADNLGTTGTIYVDFQTNEEVETETWHNIGEMQSIDTQAFVLDLGETLSMRIRLRMLSTSATIPPIIKSYDLNGWIAAPLKYQWVSNFKVGINQQTKNNMDDFKPDSIVDFLRNAFQKNQKVRMRSLKSTMDDKIVTLSAPVIVTDSLTDEGWKGHVSISIQEA